MGHIIYKHRRIVAVFALIGMVILGTSCVQANAQKIDDANEAARQDSTQSPAVGSRRISIFDIRSGDCYNQPRLAAAGDESVSLERVELVPCSGPHEFEVQKLILIDRPDGAAYPGEAYFDDVYYNDCPLESNYVVFPLPESWIEGDRVLTCIIGPE